MLREVSVSIPAAVLAVMVLNYFLLAEWVRGARLVPTLSPPPGNYAEDANYAKFSKLTLIAWKCKDPKSKAPKESTYILTSRPTRSIPAGPTYRGHTFF
jgi:hypothetical protein